MLLMLSFRYNSMLYNHNESEIWGCAQMLATLAEAVLKE